MILFLFRFQALLLSHLWTPLNNCYLHFLHLFGHVLDLLVEVLLGSLDVLLDIVARSDINDLKQSQNFSTVTEYNS
jgi:hypothetical protein